MDKVDSTMNAVNEQRELANEIAETLANPIYAGVDVDEVRLPIFYFSLVSHQTLYPTLPITLFERMSEPALSFYLNYTIILPLQRRTTGRAESGTRRATARRAEHEAERSGPCARASTTRLSARTRRK